VTHARAWQYEGKHTRTHCLFEKYFGAEILLDAVGPRSESRSSTRLRDTAIPRFAFSIEMVSRASIVFFLWHASPAYADTPPCSDSRVTFEGPIDPRFSSSVEDVCTKLSAMQNIDPSARLQILAAGRDLVLEAVLADGRSTLRRVRSPADLSLTVEALLSLPPLPPAAAPKNDAPTPLAPSGAVETAAPKTTHADPDEASRRIAAEASRAQKANPTTSVGVEIGLEFMGRMSGAPAYAGIGPLLYAGVRVDRWLFALLARWDAYEVIVGGGYPNLEYDGLGAGFMVAPRLVQLGAFEFDLGLTTTILTEEQGYEVGPTETSGTNTDLRIGVVSRALVGKGKLRGLFTLDTELSPLRLRRRPQIDPGLPKLPAFGAGVGAGIAWMGP
jgi:hypothetical protein